MLMKVTQLVGEPITLNLVGGLIIADFRRYLDRNNRSITMQNVAGVEVNSETGR